MAEAKTALWKRVLGYLAFALFAMVAAFFLTFPYDALKDRAKLEAAAAGYSLRIGSMGPGFFSIRATDVEVSKLSDADPPPEPLKLDAVSVGPTLFPPGVGVNVKAFGGALSTKLSGVSSPRVRITLDNVDLSRGNVKGFTGIDFAGTIDGAIDLTIPRVAAGSGPVEPDLGQASGTIALSTKGLTINGGTVSVPIPQYGPEPTPLDLPKIVLGDLTSHFTFDKGAGTVDEFKSKSPDIELGMSGTIKLAKRLEYAEPSLEIRVKPDAEFQKRLGLLGSALSMLGPDPKDSAWRMGRLTGFLGKPQFR